MARRVYLHIGTMKAATTYLQKLFDRNRDLLAEQGIAWFGSSRNMQAVFDWKRSPMLAPSGRGEWRRFMADVRRCDGDVLISMELLGRLNESRIQTLIRQLHTDDVRVIITARDLARAIPSHWQETTQNRRTTPWAQYAEEVSSHDPYDPNDPNKFWHHHYLPLLIRHWSTAVPREQMYLVTIPHSSSDPHTVWRRFAEVLGISPEGFTPPRFSNASLGGVSAELMRRLNGDLQDLSWQQYQKGFKSALAKQTLARRAKQEPRPALSAEQHARMRERAQVMLKEVAEEQIHVVGDLADLLPDVEPPRPGVDPAELSDRELLEAALAGLAGLGQRVGTLSGEREALRRRNRELEAMQAAPVRTAAARGLHRGTRTARSLAGRARRALRATGRR